MMQFYTFRLVCMYLLLQEEVSFSSLEEAIKTVAARSKREQVVISPIFCDRRKHCAHSLTCDRR